MEQTQNHEPTAATKPRNQMDDELLTLSRIDRMLAKLSLPVRRRLVRYLADRHEAQLEAESQNR